LAFVASFARHTGCKGLRLEESMSHSPRWISGCILAAAFGLGCSYEGEESPDRASFPVQKELAGKVEFAFRHYSDPDVARSAFATPMWNFGCSSTMIGPHILLTAAHCGPAEAATEQIGIANFTTYRASENEQNTEGYACRRLIHGWPRHDLALMFCDSNSTGLAPGDKYGYLDLETRAPQIGDSVYSIWWNNVLAGPSATLPLYSEGRVESTTDPIWSGFLGGPAGEAVGIRMSTWAQPGASGSSNIDRNTHRILVGPTTLANQTEGPARWAFSTRTYLSSELLAPGTYEGAGALEQIKSSNFPPGSYNFASYVGGVDKNANGIFDVQEDVERQIGETRRPVYWLGFDNRRRIRLWDTPNAVISFDQRVASVNVSSPGLVLRHRALNLKPNTNYRIGIRIKTTSASLASALSVGFEAPDPVVALGSVATSNQATLTPSARTASTASASTALSASASTAPSASSKTAVSAAASTALTASVQAASRVGSVVTGYAWGSGTSATLGTYPNSELWQTALITTGSASEQYLTIRATAAFAGALSEITVFEDGAIDNFELADEREGWKTPFGRANFLPRGEQAEPRWSRPDFVLAVRALFTTAIPASTDKLVFLTNRVHRLCFKARALSGTGTGLVRVTSGNLTALNATFPLTTSWTTSCYGSIATPYAGSTLTFSSSGTLETSYLVDELQLSADPNAIQIGTGGLSAAP
jgi:hypothetical protein